MVSSRSDIRLGDVAALIGPFAVGALGSVPTVRAIPTWYRSLRKPAWNPPDRVFGPVWSTLYGLMGVALVLVRRHEASSPADLRRAQAIFGLQLALNLG